MTDERLKSNRRILVFLNMSRLRPVLVSSVVVHEGSSICLFKGRQLLFYFIGNCDSGGHKN